MKRSFISFVAFFSVAMLMITSCKKDETKVTADMGNAGTLSASTTTPALSKATAANTAVNFSWPATQVTGYNAPITYTLQFAAKGTNFKTYQEMAASSTGQSSVTVGTLNGYLLGLNLTTGTPTQVEVRAKSTIAVNATPSYSNVITLNVTPYQLVSYIYLPGDYQNWDPSSQTADSLASATSNGVYTGKVTFTSTTLFQVTPARNWNTNYGGTGTSGSLVVKGPNFSLPAGTYNMTVNLNDLTFSFTK